jgi:hypothetical protein
VHRE